ncbi:hypothetical protein EVAR_18622_1 [Eumeta japonica]|uniref:Uncharacterized protein n=1 Tax=Eumeta variegata TaxID=151549 RepID=A0A4C1U6N4_EUMVA|nr:hypothetical protein EVAR_18622_1 [Eumeta japonica]
MGVFWPQSAADRRCRANRDTNIHDNRVHLSPPRLVYSFRCNQVALCPRIRMRSRVRVALSIRFGCDSWAGANPLWKFSKDKFFECLLLARLSITARDKYARRT